MGPKLDFNTGPRLTADTAAFPVQDLDSSNPFSHGLSHGRAFTDVFDTRFRHTTRPTSHTYEFNMKFVRPEDMKVSDDFDVVLPDITPYLPAGTDPDSANALIALYRTHCTSLVDAVRYCKEKQFFRLFTSFHGTLTVPVQKLFAQPEMAAWIKECDWIMYKKMIGNLSQLTLQVPPPQVIRFLDNVAKLLHGHISKVFQGLPLHVLEARLEPATLFARLVRKMLAVNAAAHAAAVLLTADDNRQEMWSNWHNNVNYKRIMEDELPHNCCNEEVYNILMLEIPALILPQQPSLDPNETVIDRIALFLCNLPGRFPQLSARALLLFVNALGSAALREITIDGGMSFQGWWLTKIFVDEMLQWLACLGGFLEHTELSMDEARSPAGESANAAVGHGSGSNESRYSSIDGEFAVNTNFTAINNAQKDLEHVEG
jgi:regulatory factor X, other